MNFGVKNDRTAPILFSCTRRASCRNALLYAGHDDCHFAWRTRGGDIAGGDKIVTRDNGVQEISWIGGRVLGRADMQRAASLRTVLLRAGCFGHGLPVRDMLVSPSHRVLLMPEHPAALAGESLIAARDLIDHREVMAVDTVRVNYIHIMFEHHQIVMSDSIWTESFHAETKTLRGMDAAQRREILSLFPELETEEGQSAQASAARPIVDYASDIRTDRMMRNII